MIEHPEDYSGPSLPCGDLTGAPVGAGVYCGRGCSCVTACGDYYDHTGQPMPPQLPPGMLAPVGVYNADWQRKAMEAAKTFTPPPLGLAWPTAQTGRPPGGWSDCGPDGEG